MREAKEALLHIERAINLAKAASQPESFSLGYSPYVSRSLVNSVRNLFSEKFGRVHLVLAPLHGEEQVDLIRKGELDGGLTLLPVVDDAIAVQSLGFEPLMVAVPEKHRLGKAKTLRLRDLKGVPMIAVIRKLCPQLHSRIHDAFAREGFQPVISDEVTAPADAVAMIATRDGFTFAHQCDVEFRCPGVVFHPVERQALALECGIVYRPDCAPPIIHALIAALQKRKDVGIAAPFAASLIA